MMVNPDYTEFLKRSKGGKIVPIVLELSADLETPVSIFLKVAWKKEHAFLLESVELEERLGRFSLIGMDPEIVLEYQDDVSKISEHGKVTKSKIPLLDSIKGILNRYRFASNSELPGLVGGLVGYVGYELVQQCEEVTFQHKKGLALPDSVFFFPTNLIVFDHIKHELKVIHLAIVRESPKKAYRKALGHLSQIERALKSSIPTAAFTPKHKRQNIRLRSNMNQKQFEGIVRRAKEYIRAGDCIQIVLSQRFSLGSVRDHFGLYRALRSVNPSPYMFYFRHPNLSLVGSSPEMLAKKTGCVAEIRPIAGTRPRGRNEGEDMAYETSLRSSPKEMAEHLMLVDLGRNDLGRVARPESVRVHDFAHVERYSHVMHLVSEIKAVLKPNRDAFDLFRASFPAGTVTGAPKIRAMQIIDELENEKRGPYAGALGYFSLSGDMDMCITIRTIVVDRNQAYVQAGAGIVNDSIPRKEFLETINKAKALLQAVRRSADSASSDLI